MAFMKPWILPFLRSARAHGRSVRTCSTGEQFRKPLRELSLAVYVSAINETSPWTMVQRAMKFNSSSSTLQIEDRSYNIHNNVHVVAFGKAVLSMAKAVENVLGDHIVTAVASVPQGTIEGLQKAGKSELLLNENTKFTVYEGGEGFLPDQQSFLAAQHILRNVSDLNETDLVICLISSGGSSLFPVPVPPLTLEGKREALEQLRRAGASAKEINLVRKHISLVKGGGLGAKSRPAKVVSLVLSNIYDEEPLAVASSPTVGDMSTPQQALEVIRKYTSSSIENESVVARMLAHKIDQSEFKRWIEMKDQDDFAICGDPGSIFMGPKPRHDCSHVQNILVGSNRQLVAAAVAQCERLGLLPYVLDATMRRQSKKMAKSMSKLAHFVCEKLVKRRAINKNLVNAELACLWAGISKRQLKEVSRMAEKSMNTGRPLCIISAGELTVKVRGEGRGGQNQEFCLAASIDLRDLRRKFESIHLCDVQILSVDTDGFDGATDVSGAFADAYQAEEVFDGRTAESYLLDNDSFGFYSSFPEDKVHTVSTGLTGTDILDIQLMLIDYPLADAVEPVTAVGHC